MFLPLKLGLSRTVPTLVQIPPFPFEMYPKICSENIGLVSLISPSDRHSIREGNENEADKNRGCGGQFSNERSGEEGAGRGVRQKAGKPPHFALAIFRASGRKNQSHACLDQLLRRLAVHSCLPSTERHQSEKHYEA